MVKALRLAGLGRGRAPRIEADDQGRMDPGALRDAVARVTGSVLVCAQAGEVNTSQLITSSNGFNPANPTAVTSSNIIDPNLKAPTTQSFVAGIDRERGRTRHLAGRVTRATQRLSTPRAL